MRLTKQPATRETTKKNLGYCQEDCNFEVPASTGTMAVHVLTTLEALNTGLLVVGYDQRNLDWDRLKEYISGFQSHYVCHPRVYTDLFVGLQTTEIVDTQLDCSKLGLEKALNYFFMLLAKLPPIAVQKPRST